MDLLIVSLTWYVVFLFSVTLHEAAHAWTARLGGDPTAYYGGQVSLDPIPHVRREPFGMVFLPLLSLILLRWPFGYASTPYDPFWAERHPRKAAWMSLAGPISNLVLVLIAAGLIRLGLQGGRFHPPDAISYTAVTTGAEPGFWDNVAMLVSMVFSLNLILFVFNLLPVPPLDGSGAVPLVLSDAAAERWRRFVRQPMIGVVGMLAVWYGFGLILRPILVLAVNLLYVEAHYG